LPQRGANLSGDQVQRVAATRMLTCDAELFVIDELSSTLDIETEEQLWHICTGTVGDASVSPFHTLLVCCAALIAFLSSWRMLCLPTSHRLNH
jgi:ABC-type transport system involved in cytochrome bd biosynthesis fused ATPase/permease subunit